jgi:hypothetical protein
MKRTTIFPPVILLVTLFTFAGCVTYKISGRGPIPIFLNSPPAKVDVMRHIDESKMIAFDYTGAFDVSEVLTNLFQETKADAIINVTISVKSDAGTFFVNLFTLGIANAHTMEVEGDLVKAPQGLGCLSVPGSEIVAQAPTLKQLKMKLSDGNGLVSGIATMITRTPSGYALVRYDASRLNPY